LVTGNTANKAKSNSRGYINYLRTNMYQRTKLTSKQKVHGTNALAIIYVYSFSVHYYTCPPPLHTYTELAQLFAPRVYWFVVKTV